MTDAMEPREDRQPPCPCCTRWAPGGCYPVEPSIAIPCVTPGCICQGVDADGCEDCWLDGK